MKTMKPGLRIVTGLNCYLVSLVLLHPRVCYPQIELPVGARALAMGAAYAGLANSAEAVWLNPAGLVQMTASNISFYYAKPYGIKTLHLGAVSLTFPLRGLRLGSGVRVFGQSGYQSSTACAAISCRAWQKVCYAVSLHFNTLQIGRYGSTSWLSWNLGLLLKVTDASSFGVYLKNLNRPHIAAAIAGIPASANIGFCHRVETHLYISLELYKEGEFDAEKRAGVELRPVNKLALRTGLASQPNRISAGFGIALTRVVCDYAFFTHPDLGLSHQLSLTLSLGKPGGEE
jgi:hypothetical protein